LLIQLQRPTNHTDLLTTPPVSIPQLLLKHLQACTLLLVLLCFLKTTVTTHHPIVITPTPSVSTCSCCSSICIPAHTATRLFVLPQDHSNHTSSYCDHAHTFRFHPAVATQGYLTEVSFLCLPCQEQGPFGSDPVAHKSKCKARLTEMGVKCMCLC